MNSEHTATKTQRIVCAALRNNTTGALLMSVRHFDNHTHDFLCSISEFERKTWTTPEQGFVDNFGNFLTREEAWVVAEKAGQIIYRCGGDGVKLFSENLY